tara:strand:+ start:294 stop:1205 length:912 start_codon:yes stop_codon:yes gene_type:complete
MLENQNINTNQKNASNSKKKRLYLLVGVLVTASIAFRLILNYNFEQTSILFVGLPALMTLLIIKYSKTPKTTFGIVFKVLTLFLLMSSILLGEGIVCILFAAPIFYGVAALIVFFYEFLKKKKKSKLNSIIILPIILISAQPFGIVSEPKTQTVETFVVVNKNTSIEAFNNSPNFMNSLPSFFKLGFPSPIGIKGTGTSIGDIREIQFKSNTKGIGTLILEVVKRNNSSIVFKPIMDDTHMNHWLTWKKMKVEVFNTNANQTKVKWTSQYQCDLGPAWYFEPLEEIAVEIMNKHLINSYFNEK